MAVQPSLCRFSHNKAQISWISSPKGFCFTVQNFWIAVITVAKSLTTWPYPRLLPQKDADLWNDVH